MELRSKSTKTHRVCLPAQATPMEIDRFHCQLRPQHNRRHRCSRKGASHLQDCRPPRVHPTMMTSTLKRLLLVFLCLAPSRQSLVGWDIRSWHTYSIQLAWIRAVWMKTSAVRVVNRLRSAHKTNRIRLTSRRRQMQTRTYRRSRVLDIAAPRSRSTSLVWPKRRKMPQVDARPGEATHTRVN